MSELGSTVAGQVLARPVRLCTSGCADQRPLYEVGVGLLLCPILLSVAIWNGFPIIFYDTGAYMLQGLGHVFIAERSPVYSLFLEVAGGRESLWLVAIAQCLMTAFVITEFARALRPSLSLWSLARDRCAGLRSDRVFPGTRRRSSRTASSRWCRWRSICCAFHGGELGVARKARCS